MVKVATGFEAPLKLLFPIKRSPVQFSLLGLGDIVIPGIFVAMTLRFDYWMHSKRSGIADASKEDAPMFRNFRKFYFKSSLVAYALSIFLTGCIMLFFKKAQPALLYLVNFSFELWTHPPGACYAGVSLCSGIIQKGARRSDSIFRKRRRRGRKGGT
eukprot:Gregarina_sp_Poly_1__7966@NODE_455_length_8267_cov_220_739024_g370_i0_p5_GENE_NODE_455_length_8267_cov_220_739024_g370_i0NODE_455_length_8267_cov_220_739024_g370_i0_p5_ORF_typecomplete_len157_score14_38Peptidase_A22B/PF04258_13/4_4e34SPP/PF06550_11/0_04_NODE_455_length_8267_cov_220_739024_g370_i068937363